MKTLSMDETKIIAGGLKSNGYNFTYLIENIAGGCFLGLCLGVITKEYQLIPAGGIIGGLYGSAMLIGNMANQLIFSDAT